MKNRWLFAACVLFFLLLTAWLKIGYYRIGADTEDDSRTVFFIKKTPTWRIKFIKTSAIEKEGRKNFKNEGLDEMLEYCRYRYGLTGTPAEIWQSCNKIEDITFPND